MSRSLISLLPNLHFVLFQFNLNLNPIVKLNLDELGLLNELNLNVNSIVKLNLVEL
jgi:hypothetical protein